MDTITKVAIVLANIGAINWGLVAMNFNLVEWIAGLVIIHFRYWSTFKNLKS
jgi:uncharacterized membrane protein YuzA (DUF378 family)